MNKGHIQKFQLHNGEWISTDRLIHNDRIDHIVEGEDEYHVVMFDAPDWGVNKRYVVRWQYAE